MGIKVELGGDSRRGEGFISVGELNAANCDHRLNLEDVGLRLPFQDDEVDELYSSHCLQRCDPYQHILHEIVRVCRVGARIELRVPHWNSAMARCCGQKHAISEEQVRHWVKDFIDVWWKGCKKRLHLTGTHYQASAYLPEGKWLYPEWTDEQVMKYVPNMAHELRFWFDVVSHG